MQHANQDIISQHAEEAAFLWSQHVLAVRAPHYRLRDLARLDERLEAHLDGLRINGDVAIEAVTALAAEDAGAMFSAALLAIDAGEHDRTEKLIAPCAGNPILARGFASALGWLEYEQTAIVIQRLFDSADASHLQIAIAASAIHRENPGAVINRALNAEEPPLRARALRALGELRDSEALIALMRRKKPDDPASQFWAAWSAALTLRDPDSIQCLQRIAEKPGPFAIHAAEVAVRMLDAKEVDTWWRDLADDPAQPRVAIAAAGALGKLEAIPWLMQQMELPATARRAGEAFSLISGVHIAYDKVERAKPEGFESGPNDDPADGNVEMDADDNLAWPDPARVKKWWSGNQEKFDDGRRYLCGKQINDQSLNDVLRNGYQRQRTAAALELAIRQPGAPLFEVRAPAPRQRKMLGV